MTLLAIPRLLEERLRESNEINTALTEFVSAASQILDDDRLFFFPDFTDHGLSHVQNVLDDQLQLLGLGARENLSTGDSFLLVVSSVVHDLGMHISKNGFRELITRSNNDRPSLRFWPDDTLTTSPEWRALWEDFVVEARKWNDESNQNVFGKLTPDIAPNDWNSLERSAIDPDQLPTINEDSIRLIGEFLRRHHARIAHEITTIGFPGNSTIPVLFEKVPQLADLAGFVARSHHHPIRKCADFLRCKFGGSKLGTADTNYVLAMGLLRISDYLQIDFSRASTVVFNMRCPTSPVSIREWQKHEALSRPSFASPEEKRIHFDVRKAPTHSTFLALTDLLANVQHELDQTNGAIAEYSNAGLIRFARVSCDLFEPSFTSTLPYVAKSTAIAVDPKVLSLLVSPVYDDDPSYGVRELLQNALDAVHQRSHFVKNNGIESSNLEFEDFDGDVELRLIQINGDLWEFVVTDKGLGMTEKVVHEHFLRVGSSFRDSDEFRKQFVSNKKKTQIDRSGRFGVGVFSAFMLGHEINVRTRHVASDQGYEFNVTFNEGFADQASVEIKKVPDARHGTQLRIPMSKEAIVKLGVTFKADSHEIEDVSKCGDKWDWYVRSMPSVKRVVQLQCGTEVDLPSRHIRDRDPNNSLRCFKLLTPDVAEFIWSIEDDKEVGLDINGILIGKSANFGRGRFGMSSSRLQVEFDDKYPVMMPVASIVDRDSAIPISLKRDQTIKGGLNKTTSRLADDLIWNWLGFCMACAPSEATTDKEVVLDPSSPFFQSFPFKRGTSTFIHQDNSIHDIDIMQFNWLYANNAIHVLAPGIISTVPFRRIVHAGFTFSSDYVVRTLPIYRLQIPEIQDTAFAFENSVGMGRGFGEGKNFLPTLGRIVLAGENKYLEKLGAVSGVRIIVGTERKKFEEMLRSHGMSSFRFEGQIGDGPVCIFGVGENPAICGFEHMWASQFAATPPQFREIVCPYIAVVELTDRDEAEPDEKFSERWLEEFGESGIPYLEDSRAAWVTTQLERQPKLKPHYEAWHDYKSEWRQHIVDPKQ